jgi:hypothetical protein
MNQRQIGKHTESLAPAIGRKQFEQYLTPA